MQTFKTSLCLPHDLTFAPDGRHLLVGAQTRVLLDTLATDPPRTLAPPGGESAVHARLVHGGDALVYLTRGGQLHAWHFATDGRLVRWLGAGQYVGHFAVSPDGATVYAACVNPLAHPRRTQPRAFEAATGRLSASYPHCDGDYSGLAVSADGRRMVGRDADGMVCAWDLTAPYSPDSVVRMRIGGSGNTLGFAAPSGDGTNLVTLSTRGVTLWDLTARPPAEVFRSGKHKRRPTAAACSPTKPLIATGDAAGQIFLWDHTGRVLNRYDWGLGAVVALCFAPDGLRCAAADDAGKLVVWDVDT